ncbi:MAG TPA: PAS domain S-box protein [Acidobacteriaceae bacterium]|nr:PAS domain S-box protein [Acidobacteriaceae bacterium]
MSLVVRVIAPTGRDAELVVRVLRQNGLSAEVCEDLSFMRNPTHDEVGPLVIAEEALKPAFVQLLSERVRNQPEWSDLPILILTNGSREIPRGYRITYDRMSIGSPILLERPIRTATLITTILAALRARKRQYEIRDTLRDRDRVLSELKLERETTQVVLDNVPAGILLVDSRGNAILGNRSVERILRLPVSQIAGRRPHDRWVAFHPDGRPVEPEEYPLPRAMRSGQPVAPEDLLYQRGDGAIAWISVAAAPVFDEKGHVSGAVVAISDIDQQKRTDYNLHRSDERFRRLIEHSTVGMIIGDLQGGIAYANPAILNLLGYTSEEVASGALRWDELTPPEFAAADHKAIQELRATGTATSYQKSLLAKDGRLLPFLIGATMIPSARSGDASSEIAVFATDLSTQKQAESALIQSEKLAAVGRLAASISHEINNPLEAITNLLYLARRSSNIPGEIATFLDKADQELQRVTQISIQTLRFHRQSTKPRLITSEELLGPTLALYHGRITNSNIRLELQHRGAEPIVCYEGDIRQVLNNLIGNAIDSMRSGGRLIVRTGKARLRRNGIPAIRITIADTGHGIPPAVMRRMYEPFFTTKGMNGTGLGLWISRGIIEKHRGQIQARSRLSNGCCGTVFSLVLPTRPFEQYGECA